MTTSLETTPPTDRGDGPHGHDGGPDRWRPPRWWGALAGLVAVLVALGVGQLVAGFAPSLQPPVVSVGDRVIDAAPPSVKDFAVEAFGTNDKPALVTGTIGILVLLSIAAGILALRRRLGLGLGLVAVFGAIGMVAATAGRNGTGNGWVPSLLAALAAGATLVAFRRLSYPPAAPAGVTVAAGHGSTARLAGAGPTRRNFLFGVGGLTVGAGVAAAAGRGLRSRFSTDLERAGVRVRTPARPLAAPPPDPALGIDGLSPLFVANADFYRIDTALLTPSVSTDSWELTIDGMVDRPLTLRYDELWNRELVEYDVTLSCVSNEIGGGLVGNARWTGVRLDALLEEAGVDPDADQIMGHSVDGFTAGFPVGTLADGRNAIVALTMNGEVLPVAHGYPARLVIPGLYGYVSATKWLSRIELTRFDRAAGYWIPRGWSVEGPVKTQCRIDTPRQGRTIRAGEVVIAGVAWAPGLGITNVEAQVDDGPWREATLGPEVATTSWRQWWVSWATTPGRHVLRCRATDGTGTTQTEKVTSVAPDGASGWHSVPVNVDG